MLHKMAISMHLAAIACLMFEVDGIVTRSLGVLHPENIYPLSVHASPASRLLVADRALWRRRGHGACQSESGVAVAWLG